MQALRLTPVGDDDVFGRSGLLAHPYMLGPNGDSNGCVSFKNYDTFLRAYQGGQVKRLAVVAEWVEASLNGRTKNCGAVSAIERSMTSGWFLGAASASRPAFRQSIHAARYIRAPRPLDFACRGEEFTKPGR